MVRLEQRVNVHGHLLDLGGVEVFNPAHHTDIVGCNELESNHLTAEETTTKRMDVVLAAGREIIVDEQGHLLDVVATSQKTGGN